MRGRVQVQGQVRPDSHQRRIVARGVGRPRRIPGGHHCSPWTREQKTQTRKTLPPQSTSAGDVRPRPARTHGGLPRFLRAGGTWSRSHLPGRRMRPRFFRGLRPRPSRISSPFPRAKPPQHPRRRGCLREPARLRIDRCRGLGLKAPSLCDRSPRAALLSCDPKRGPEAGARAAAAWTATAEMRRCDPRPKGTRIPSRRSAVEEQRRTRGLIAEWVAVGPTTAEGVREWLAMNAGAAGVGDAGTRPGRLAAKARLAFGARVHRTCVAHRRLRRCVRERLWAGMGCRKCRPSRPSPRSATPTSLRRREGAGARIPRRRELFRPCRRVWVRVGAGWGRSRYPRPAPTRSPGSSQHPVLRAHSPDPRTSSCAKRFSSRLAPAEAGRGEAGVCGGFRVVSSTHGVCEEQGRAEVVEGTSRREGTAVGMLWVAIVLRGEGAAEEAKQRRKEGGRPRDCCSFLCARCVRRCCAIRELVGRGNVGGCETRGDSSPFPPHLGCVRS